MKNPWILGVGWLLLFLIAISFANGGYGMMGWYGDMMGGMFLYGFLYLILITALASLIFSMIFKGIWKDRDKKEDSLEILKSRYAKGEISKEQFESMKKDIQGKNTTM